LKIERKKITEKCNYFKECTQSDKTPFVARDLHIYINLLDIVLEKDNLLVNYR
jgi:hypothetical protein